MAPKPQYSTLPEAAAPLRIDSDAGIRPRLPPKPTRPPPIVPGASTRPPSRTMGSTRCCICQSNDQAWTCLQCDDSFCNRCWPQQRPHLVSSGHCSFFSNSGLASPSSPSCLGFTSSINHKSSNFYLDSSFLASQSNSPTEPGLMTLLVARKDRNRWSTTRKG